MAENKKSFILYADLIRTIDHLTLKEKGILFDHLLKYVNDENPKLDNRLILTAWKPIEMQLKRDLKKFNEVKVKRSDAGKLSAKIRAERKQQNSTKSTSVESVEQTSTNPTDNDTVNDTVNVTKVIPTQKINFLALLDFINTNTGKKLRVINEATKRKFNGRLKEGYKKDDILKAIKNASKDKFHIDNNYKYLTPEFFSRSATLDKFGDVSKPKAKEIPEHVKYPYGRPSETMFIPK